MDLVPPLTKIYHGGRRYHPHRPRRRPLAVSVCFFASLLSVFLFSPFFRAHRASSLSSHTHTRARKHTHKSALSLARARALSLSPSLSRETRAARHARVCGVFTAGRSARCTVPSPSRTLPQVSVHTSSGLHHFEGFALAPTRAARTRRVPFFSRLETLSVCVTMLHRIITIL